MLVVVEKLGERAAAKQPPAVRARSGFSGVGYHEAHPKNPHATQRLYAAHAKKSMKERMARV
ncbi:MAG: hypothetical protein WB780_17720, partial [Candidatus Acidiferrales bacterium]